ncbi:c-type cytochrome [Flavobacterium rhizosphaerae]|uniref:Cytochrome c n=1 Tax=Flavobacterium rhizosphaerae TaxID=3163298 RepID=A0ABW8YUI4_9FLAO
MLNKGYFYKTAIVAVVSVMLYSFNGFNTVNRQDGLKQSIERGKKIYTQTCVSCHQVNGTGVPHLAPPLKGTDYVLKNKPRLIHIVLDGFNEDVEIEGEYYVNPMPAFNTLNDQQVADVLTYIRNSFGNKADAVTAAEVKAQRKK